MGGGGGGGWGGGGLREAGLAWGARSLLGGLEVEVVEIVEVVAELASEDLDDLDEGTLAVGRSLNPVEFEVTALFIGLGAGTDEVGPELRKWIRI